MSNQKQANSLSSLSRFNYQQQISALKGVEAALVSLVEGSNSSLNRGASCSLVMVRKALASFEELGMEIFAEVNNQAHEKRLRLENLQEEKTNLQLELQALNMYDPASVRNSLARGKIDLATCEAALLELQR